MTPTNRQKGALAMLLLQQAGTLVEFWTATTEDSNQAEDLDGMTADEAAVQLARWLQHLPGTGWDTRLPDPSTLKG